MLFSLLIVVPAALVRWVFLKRPINKLIAVPIAASIWLLLLWMHHEGGGEGTPAAISIAAIGMYLVLVAPLSEKPAASGLTPPPSP